ncbi:MAG: hypothetical protein K2K98_03785 [Muribaculaceae bacterium]|nr:hypothetical protein [Muribaculaceae bacterium]
MNIKYIIFKSEYHPEWKELKISNPKLYQELKRRSVSERLNELIPIYQNWQKRTQKFTIYENSLPDVETQLKSIDFENYNNGWQIRLKLAKSFYQKCMCYPVDRLNKESKKFSDYKWIIKDLINKSIITLYKRRIFIYHRIEKSLSLSSHKIEKIPLWGYLPFYNHLVGVEWIKSRIGDNIKDLAKYWLVLLCFDETMFSSDLFIESLTNTIGNEMVIQLKTNLINKFNARQNYYKKEFPVTFKKLNEWKEVNCRLLSQETSINQIYTKDQTSKTGKVDTNKIPLFPSAMDDPVVKTEESIIRGVKAKDFIVKCGSISYGKHSLISSKIKSDVPSSVLSLIDYRFTLKMRINYTKSGKIKHKRFSFEPFEDLSVLLSECERILKITSIKPLDYFPQSGKFYLPWKYVFFYDNIMYLAHPNPSKYGSVNPFAFRHPYITKSFRDLMSYIEDRCPKFYVRAIDGVIVALLNFKSFQQMIPQFREYSSETLGGIDELSYSKLRNSYSSTDFSHLKFVKKSPYLSHLSSLQVSSRKIYRILERVIHAQADTDFDEFGFLFTVMEYRSYSIVIYENASDESRSSILFQVRTSEFEEAIEVIRSFFASNEANKRQRLAQSTIRLKSPAILSYRRIHHTNFYDWRLNLSGIL